MNDANALTVDTVADYIASRPTLAALVDPAELSVDEVGDGNLNLVFRCRDGSGRRLCLKQSLPYVRVAGPSWPLTRERATAEARGYEAAARWSPETIPAWHGYDHGRHVLAMEDLAGWRVWRDVLVEGRRHDGVHRDLGRHVARLTAGTARWNVPGPEFRAAVAAASNPEMCEITEDLVLSDPFLGHDRNDHVDGLVPAVAALRTDRHALDAVARAREAFCTRTEALIHGDLHTGSVMVDEGGGGGPARAKVIDAEFCCYGPVAFDLGLLLGNLGLAHARWAALGAPPTDLEWMSGLPSAIWAEFEAELRAAWPRRLDRAFTDRWFEHWLTLTKADAVRVAGCAAIRRMVGFAKSADLETLDAEVHLPAAIALMDRASWWLRDADRLDPSDLLA